LRDRSTRMVVLLAAAVVSTCMACNVRRGTKAHDRALATPSRDISSAAHAVSHNRTHLRSLWPRPSRP
jgi:hypothetical protein